MKENKGFIVQGGTVNINQMAVGENSRVYNITSPMLSPEGVKELQAKLNTLLQSIDQHRAELRDTPEVHECVKSVAEELEKPKPSKLASLSLLESISQHVRSVTGVATAVEALKLAITTLLH